jgi:hypothetical protein
MDIARALRELHTEKKRLDAAIAALEARVKTGRSGPAGKPVRGRRGRKSMSAAERLEVSKRMTLYWETKRAQRRPPAETSEAPASNRDQQASTTAAS